VKAWFNHPLRVTSRLFWLTGEFMLAACTYAIRCGFRQRHALPGARAAWLQHTSRRFLRVFHVEMQAFGNVPSSGLLVCNHLSYLDILVLAAVSPCLFGSKSEVKYWPVFGWFARLAGTVFISREKRTQAAQSVNEIEDALRTGVLVVLFPEGTSSGGETVLAFKSSLLASAAGKAHALAAGFLRYELADGEVSEEVCYWKDMNLVPHLVNLLSKRAVHASVRITKLEEGSSNRKILARQLHGEVVRMMETGAV